MWLIQFISLLFFWGIQTGAPSTFDATQQSKPENIEGNWKGIITQEEGGYRAEYKFELFIRQKGKNLSGRSYVYVDDLNAEMEILGEFQTDQSLILKDIKLIGHQEHPGMEWCLRKLYLSYKIEKGEMKLEGNWEGKTSFSTCTPGLVKLKKIKPRA